MGQQVAIGALDGTAGIAHEVEALAVEGGSLEGLLLLLTEAAGPDPLAAGEARGVWIARGFAAVASLRALPHRTRR